MIQALHNILGVLFLFAVVACSADINDTPESIATDLVESPTRPTSTLNATNTPTLTLPQTPVLISTGTTAPLAEDDAFLVEMQSKDYHMTQSGSITDARGIVYSAYIFLEPLENRRDRLDPVVKETWIIAFYRWDGVENKLLNIFYPPVYDKRFSENGFPVLIALANLDNPNVSMLFLDFAIMPDQELYSVLRLEGFSSDINHNDKLEFLIAAQYCPVSCSRPQHTFQFYEISSDTEVVELVANLPGHIEFIPYSVDPLLYAINQEQWYGFTSQINIPSIYQWQDDGFVDVTVEYAELMQADIQSRIDELKGFKDSSIVSEREQELLIEVLQMYQQAKLRDEGLQVFLELTQLENWPNADQDSLCWLQIARAQAQDEFERGAPFSIPRSTYTALNTFVERAQDIIDEKDLGNYDVSACMQE